MCEQSSIGLSDGAEASGHQAREQKELSWFTLVAKDARAVPHTQASIFMEAQRSSVTCSRSHGGLWQVCYTKPAVEPWKSYLASPRFCVPHLQDRAAWTWRDNTVYYTKHYIFYTKHCLAYCTHYILA